MFEQVAGSSRIFLEALGYNPKDAVSTKQFWEDVKKGTLQSAEVMPKLGKAFAEAAGKGGALQQQLRSNAREMQRMYNTFKEVQDDIFKGGFKEGLNSLARAFTSLLTGIRPLATGLGFVLGNALSGLMLPLRVTGELLQSFFGVTGDEGFSKIAQRAGEILKLYVAFKTLNLALKGTVILLRGLIALIVKFKKITGITAVVGAIASELENSTLFGDFTGNNPHEKDSMAYKLWELKKRSQSGGYDIYRSMTGNLESQQLQQRKLDINITTDENGLLKATAKELDVLSNQIANDINKNYGN